MDSDKELEELRSAVFVLKVINRNLHDKLEKAEHDRDRYRERLDIIRNALKQKE